jgi:excinuclease UvrABC nuclease subunit
LAKQHELLFVPDKSDPIALPRNSSALHLLQRIRDEAHRFAITHHRKKRGKAQIHSLLDDVPVSVKRGAMRYWNTSAVCRKFAPPAPKKSP